MPGLKTIAKYLPLGLAMCVALLLAVSVTGQKKRTYKTLLPKDTVTIAGSRITAEGLALEYQPEMYLRPTTSTPPLEWVWYEVTPADSTIDITYHFTWQNEVNPNIILHYVYAVFRAVYYGYPLYDIEYFQVNVSRASGAVQRIRFETTSSDNYYPTTVRHIRVAIDRDAKGNYYKTCNEDADTKERITPEFDQNKIKAGVQTWNHLTRLLDAKTNAEYSQLLQAPLKYLSNIDYVKYKFTRKSQGDHRS